MQFRSIVERIIQKDGESLFALRGRAGIYQMPKDSTVFPALAAAHKARRPVMITSDAELNILEVCTIH